MMKRVIDVVGSAAGLVFLSPVMISVAVAVAIWNGRPVLFVQSRPGLDGRVFGMYKFRTMTDQRDANGDLLPDERRLTRLGALLRSTSLDELPSLVNILRGEMSLVGPRPLLVAYLPLYSTEQRRRHEVKPGLTGLAQINGRNALTWEQRFELDVWYVDNRTTLLDLRILAATVLKVIRRDNISAEGHATMQPFSGTDANNRH